MQNLALEKHGRCLSDVYVNTKTKLTWECSKGHQWESVPGSIMQGCWCPKCAGQAKPSIGEMQSIAIQRTGKCLSKVYVSTHEKLRWECAEGHKWSAVPSSIKRGSWCPFCATTRKGITQRLDI